jgi:PIN domain nuclease of toxin-antitoxin system
VRLLLDTCTFLWIVAGARELSARARAAFVDPDHEILLSSVSVWEIAVKHALGKLPLAAPVHDFVPAERSRHGIVPLALDEEAVLHLGRLPDLHRDPFDRMLVCQAICHGMTLLTPDPLISRYPARTLW